MQGKKGAIGSKINEKIDTNSSKQLNNTSWGNIWPILGQSISGTKCEQTAVITVEPPYHAKYGITLPVAQYKYYRESCFAMFEVCMHLDLTWGTDDTKADWEHFTPTLNALFVIPKLINYLVCPIMSTRYNFLLCIAKFKPVDYQGRPCFWSSLIFISHLVSIIQTFLPPGIQYLW